GHSAPAAGCHFGIYALGTWPRLGDRRLYEEAAAPLRLMALTQLSVVALGGAGARLVMEGALIRRGGGAAALVASRALMRGVGRGGGGGGRGGVRGVRWEGGGGGAERRRPRLSERWAEGGASADRPPGQADRCLQAAGRVNGGVAPGAPVPLVRAHAGAEIP